MKIKEIPENKVPYDLLFLADEDEKQIEKYKKTALFLAAYDKNQIRGTIGIKEIHPREYEIVSLAVYEDFQNRGIGTELIEKAIDKARQKRGREILIKTGDCGIAQLYLYQRCGFRFEKINKDYFPKYYPLPIYENSLQCRDQIVLKYRIYSEEELKTIHQEYWQRFLIRNREYKGRPYETWHFCYGESLPNKLLGLVKTGKKRGTCSARELYEADEKIPEKGDLSLITYGNGLPGCVIVTIGVTEKKFRDISAEEARIEGEGDLSLDYWRKAHEFVFKKEYEDEVKDFSWDIPVIFEEFEVLYDEDRKDLSGEVL